MASVNLATEIYNYIGYLTLKPQAASYCFIGGTQIDKMDLTCVMHIVKHCLPTREGDSEEQITRAIIIGIAATLRKAN